MVWFQTMDETPLPPLPLDAEMRQEDLLFWIEGRGHAPTPLLLVWIFFPKIDTVQMRPLRPPKDPAWQRTREIERAAIDFYQRWANDSGEGHKGEQDDAVARVHVCPAGDDAALVEGHPDHQVFGIGVELVPLYRAYRVKP